MHLISTIIKTDFFNLLAPRSTSDFNFIISRLHVLSCSKITCFLSVFGWEKTTVFVNCKWMSQHKFITNCVVYMAVGFSHGILGKFPIDTFNRAFNLYNINIVIFKADPKLSNWAQRWRWIPHSKMNLNKNVYLINSYPFLSNCDSPVRPPKRYCRSSK